MSNPSLLGSPDRLPRISILGGGWLGAPLATYLEQKGYATQVSTASQERYETLKEKHPRVFQMEVQEARVVGNWQAFSQAEVLVVNIPPNRSESEQFSALLPLIAAAPIKQVLFVSSISVYISENKEVREGDGAVDTEHLLYKSEQAFQQTAGFATTVLRLAGLIGGDRHPGRFFQRSGLIKQADTPVNLVHRLDCLEAIYQVIAQNYWGKVVHLCADTHPLKMDFYPTAAASLGLPSPLVEQKGPLPTKLSTTNK